MASLLKSADEPNGSEPASQKRLFAYIVTPDDPFGKQVVDVHASSVSIVKPDRPFGHQPARPRQ
jgi:hypothetical protein